MKLSKNEADIIKLLISSNTFISSYDIELATGINRRIVRNEMKKVKYILEVLDFELISKSSKGYRLDLKSSEDFQYLSDLIEDSKSDRESLFPTTPSQREMYIIKHLCEAGHYVKIETMADNLLVSRSTISNDISQAKLGLNKYHLILQQKPSYGLRITGKEEDLRKPICDFYFGNLRDSKMFYDYLHTFFKFPHSLEYDIISIIHAYPINLSDFALIDFLLCLSIMINRVSNHHTITYPQDISLIQDRFEFEIAKKIGQVISNTLSISLNQQEINQMAIQLICKQSNIEMSPFNEEEVTLLTHDIIKAIEEQTLFSLNSPHFIQELNNHVQNTLLRLHYNEKIRSPLFDILQSAYPFSYECAKITSRIFHQHYHHYLSSSELALFTTIFHDEIHNYEKNKKNVLLICGLGQRYGELCRSQILRRLSNKIEISKIISYYQLISEDLSQYDFIISLVPIHYELSLPIITISQIIADEDIDKIDHYISYLFQVNQIQTLFHPQLYLPNASLQNKKELAAQFYYLLSQLHVSLKHSLERDLFNPEMSEFYALENEIAIIKLKKPLNNSKNIAVITLETPILIHNQAFSFFILFPCVDTKNYIFNRIYSITENLSENLTALHNIKENGTYSYFLKTFIGHQS